MLSVLLFLKQILIAFEEDFLMIKSSFEIPSPNLIVSVPALSVIVSFPSPMLKI